MEELKVFFFASKLPAREQREVPEQQVTLGQLHSFLGMDAQCDDDL